MTNSAYVVKEMHIQVKPGTAAQVDYQCEVMSVKVNPSPSVQSIAVACPGGVVTAPGVTTYTVDIDYTVSLKATALYRVMLVNDGLPATITIEPNPVSEPGFKETWPVIISAGSADWSVGQFGTGSASWPVTGAVTFVDGP